MAAFGCRLGQASPTTRYVATGVATLRADGTNLYAGGNFTIAGELTVNGIAKWGGTNWSAFGEPLNEAGFALAHDGTSVYVGGDLTTYRILATTNLSQPFAPLSGPIPSAGTNTSYTNAVGSDPAWFFQIQEVQP